MASAAGPACAPDLRGIHGRLLGSLALMTRYFGSVLAGTVNAMGWSSVLIYGFFLVAWARIAMGASATAQPA